MSSLSWLIMAQAVMVFDSSAMLVTPIGETSRTFCGLVDITELFDLLIKCVLFHLMHICMCVLDACSLIVQRVVLRDPTVACSLLHVRCCMENSSSRGGHCCMFTVACAPTLWSPSGVVATVLGLSMVCSGTATVHFISAWMVVCVCESYIGKPM